MKTTIKARIEKTTFARHIALLPENAKEAKVAVDAILARDGWTAESIARQIAKRGWTRKPGAKLTLAELTKRGVDVKAIARLARPRA